MVHIHIHGFTQDYGVRGMKKGQHKPDMHSVATQHGWQQRSASKVSTWAKEEDGSRPQTESSSVYTHPQHHGHELRVFPSAGSWFHEKPTQFEYRGKTKTGMGAVAKGNGAESFVKHLAEFHRPK